MDSSASSLNQLDWGRTWATATQAETPQGTFPTACNPGNLLRKRADNENQVNHRGSGDNGEEQVHSQDRYQEGKGLGTLQECSGPTAKPCCA